MPLSAVSLGAGPELLAVATSARHDLDPGVRAWASFGRPYGASVEVAVVGRSEDHPDLYRYTTWTTQAAALGEVALGGHATVVRLGLGPAVVVRRIGVTSDALDVASWQVDPALRGRLAFDGPLPGLGPLGWQVRVGGTGRAAGVDWDMGAGLGVRW